ncbi:hypothetical protein GZ77_21590 [Endozoicomonas montiporae]|uniref:FCP1 homology domain-containing protein n=2 Tax=Endozoicomonas montiporae TaxID=1027273 RepID=A0A081N3J1_9GAMM|nr:DUF2608 domain-containing protein [Endozoicomonas montiporae]AMO58321.1 hypothetical protein EZMO1_4405 [Endozoicomonas montiporae CL-33]KEQ13014.1 hypothetical protein GZ77_21590 [Endozoicomonas montiporae]
MSKIDKFIRWLVAIWFMALIINTHQASASPAGQKTVQQETTAKPGQFLQQKLANGTLKKGSLVILDLDDTTITTPEGQWLGRSEMFYRLVDKEQRRSPDRTRQEIVNDIDPLLSFVYSRVPVQLTDSILPEVIQQLNSQNVLVIGMTARGMPVADVTRSQLKEVGITFSDTGAERLIALPEDRHFIVEHGVVMAGQGNKKGEVLTALINEKVLPVPEQVMLIDDRDRHLNTVRDALERFDPTITYRPVLCNYLKDKKRFNAIESEQQLFDFLYQWRDDKEVAHFVEQDAYSQGFIARCRNIPDRQKQCEGLQKQFGVQPAL